MSSSSNNRLLTNIVSNPGPAGSRSTGRISRISPETHSIGKSVPAMPPSANPANSIGPAEPAGPNNSDDPKSDSIAGPSKSDVSNTTTAKGPTSDDSLENAIESEDPANKVSSDATSFECPICTEVPVSYIPLSKPETCEHQFCLICLRRWIQTQYQDHVLPACPLCRKRIKSITVIYQEAQFPEGYDGEKVLDMTIPNYVGMTQAVVWYTELVARLESHSRKMGIYSTDGTKEILLMLDVEDMLVALKMGVQRRSRPESTDELKQLLRVRPMLMGVMEAANRALKKSRLEHMAELSKPMGSIPEEDETSLSDEDPIWESEDDDWELEYHEAQIQELV